MIYADFNFYQLEYYGQQIKDPSDYNRLATRAAAELDYYTFGRASEHTDLEAVKLCACAVAEQCQIIEASESRSSGAAGELASESVGSYSRTYRSSAERSRDAREAVKDTIVKYLFKTGLLYRGMPICSHRIP